MTTNVTTNFADYLEVTIAGYMQRYVHAAQPTLMASDWQNMFTTPDELECLRRAHQLSTQVNDVGYASVRLWRAGEPDLVFTVSGNGQAHNRFLLPDRARKTGFYAHDFPELAEAALRVRRAERNAEAARAIVRESASHWCKTDASFAALWRDVLLMAEPVRQTAGVRSTLFAGKVERMKSKRHRKVKLPRHCQRYVDWVIRQVIRASILAPTRRDESVPKIDVHSTATRTRKRLVGQRHHFDV